MALVIYFQQSKVSVVGIYTVINHANKCTYCALHTEHVHNFCVLIVLKARRGKNKSRFSWPINTTKQRQWKNEGTGRGKRRRQLPACLLLN